MKDERHKSLIFPLMDKLFPCLDSLLSYSTEKKLRGLGVWKLNSNAPFVITLIG